ncbi:MAG: non-heme iron oxygenase ferredoxin subunit [Ardenticatenia bacterium]|nr:non-heme iron oxygenase ferredoxin subunit [Ardenticatenia bacterium]
MREPDFVPVLGADELPLGRVKVVEVNGRRVALAHCEEGIFAVDDLCTHDGGPLGEGELDGCAIECPRHGAQFDVRTGQVRRFPAVKPIRTYPVKVEDGHIHVAVAEE